MISSIPSNAGWLPAGHAPHVSLPEVPGETENDGDRDDVAGSAKARASSNFSEYVGNKINTLA